MSRVPGTAFQLMSAIDQRQLGQRLRTSSGASAVITILHQNPNDVDLLNALVNLCADPECWQFLRKAGAVELFIGLMLREPGRLLKGSDVCHWKTSCILVEMIVFSLFPYGCCLSKDFLTHWSACSDAAKAFMNLKIVKR